jgi:hypothetical protein
MTHLSIDMFFRLVFAALAFCLAGLATSKLAGRAVDEVKQSQIEDVDRPLFEGRMYWTLVRLRADVAGIYLMLILTNGLIAAVLAALIF